MSGTVRLAVFAPGGGTNLQALLDRFNAGDESVARVELVVASREGIGAVTRAEAAGVPCVVIDPAGRSTDDAADALMAVLTQHSIDLIALAGYLKLVPPRVVGEYEGRILNIHPALLPAFGGPGMYGLRVHAAVLKSGAKVSGATVHLVDERYDEGRIVAQWPVPVLPDDTPKRLAARVLPVEHMLYPLAIETLVRGGAAEPLGGERSFDLVQAQSPPVESLRRLVG